MAEATWLPPLKRCEAWWDSCMVKVILQQNYMVKLDNIMVRMSRQMTSIPVTQTGWSGLDDAPQSSDRLKSVLTAKWPGAGQTCDSFGPACDYYCWPPCIELFRHQSTWVSMYDITYYFIDEIIPNWFPLKGSPLICRHLILPGVSNFHSLVKVVTSLLLTPFIRESVNV